MITYAMHCGINTLHLSSLNSIGVHWLTFTSKH
uniref:Uncharacterized protein n=1 Tax=Rhizophora mucronata TaxID=61149 RepID=A0A2P2L174_RHIMU